MAVLPVGMRVVSDDHILAKGSDGKLIHCFLCAATESTYIISVGGEPIGHEVGKRHALDVFVRVLGVCDVDGAVSEIMNGW